MAFRIAEVSREPEPWTSFDALVPQTFPPGFRVTLEPSVAPFEGDHALGGMKALLSPMTTSVRRASMVTTGMTARSFSTSTNHSILSQGLA